MQKKNILVTGGAGFIGSHLLRYFVNKYPGFEFINLDKLTYAGNLENLKDLEKKNNYHFIKGCITDTALVNKIFKSYSIDNIIHLAAESHVDKSITDPQKFVKTNVIGTINLLECFKNNIKNNFVGKFYHVSTDEVYGSLGKKGLFTENHCYNPNSPYSASKASSDHFVRAYSKTYGIPYIISNCSNNYGSHQFPEKLIPLVIYNVMNNIEIPVYGDGSNIRDWIYVNDHVEAIDIIFNSEKINETYNIGGGCESNNLDLVYNICSILDTRLGRKNDISKNLIRFVTDRLGHDFRYAIDSSKIKRDFGWSPKKSLFEGLEDTVDWYIENHEWFQNIKSGSYKNYYFKKSIK